MFHFDMLAFMKPRISFEQITVGINWEWAVLSSIFQMVFMYFALSKLYVYVLILSDSC